SNASSMVLSGSTDAVTAVELPPKPPTSTARMSAVAPAGIVPSQTASAKLTTGGPPLTEALAVSPAPGQSGMPTAAAARAPLEPGPGSNWSLALTLIKPVAGAAPAFLTSNTQSTVNVPFGAQVTLSCRSGFGTSVPPWAA